MSIGFQRNGEKWNENFGGQTPEKTWECLFCHYGLTSQCLLPKAEGAICLLNLAQDCPYLTTKE